MSESKTNIEYFNHTLKLFINDIIKIFPCYQEPLEEYYQPILENESCNDDKFIKRFMRKMEAYKTQISKKEVSMFSESICIFKNVDFKEIWEHEDLGEKGRETVWNYLQTLYVIGDTIISDSNRIKNLLENFKKTREDNEIEQVDGNDETSTAVATASAPAENDELMNMIQNLSNNAQQNQDSPAFDESLLGGGLIGNLAKELAEEINIDELNLNLDENNGNVNDILGGLMSGNNPMKFMNLIQNVGQKIENKLSDGNIDQGDLVKEAQNMMGMLGSNNPMFDSMMKNMQGEMRNANPPKEDSSNNSTRDRLRRKLEQRKKDKK